MPKECRSESKIFTAIINIVVGVAVISLLSGVGRVAIRPAALPTIPDRPGLPGCAGAGNCTTFAGKLFAVPGLSATDISGTYPYIGITAGKDLFFDQSGGQSPN